MLRKWNVTLVVSAFLLVDLRHVHHAQRRDLERALVRAVAGRQVVRRVPRHRDRGDGVSRGDAAQRSRGEGRAREHGQPRGGVPVQQSAARRDRVLGAVGNALPDPQRSGARQQDHRRSAVLQHGQHSARAAAARAHGHRAADRVAPRVGGESQAAVPGAGDRRHHDRRRRCFAFGMRDVCALVAYTFGGFVRARSCRSSGRASARGVACTARSGDRASCASSRAIAGATAATSCTSASSMCSRRSPGLAFKEEFDLTLKRRRDLRGRRIRTATSGRFVSQGVSRYDELNRQVTAVAARAFRERQARRA